MAFHSQLCAEIARQLTPRLLPRYVALMGKNFVTEVPDDLAIANAEMYPDVGVLTISGPAAPDSAISVQPAPIELLTAMPTRIPQHNVQIRDVQNRKLVTAIEVLSPANKRGSGKRVPMRQSLPHASYYILLSRIARRPLTEVWPIQLQERLPNVPIPLRNGDGDVPLELQKAFDIVYDTSGFAVLVNDMRRMRDNVGRGTIVSACHRQGKQLRQRQLKTRDHVAAIKMAKSVQNADLVGGIVDIPPRQSRVDYPDEAHAGCEIFVDLEDKILSDVAWTDKELFDFPVTELRFRQSHLDHRDFAQKDWQFRSR